MAERCYYHDCEDPGRHAITWRCGRGHRKVNWYCGAHITVMMDNAMMTTRRETGAAYPICDCLAAMTLALEGTG